MHEASLWPENCFITLTYETAPYQGSLVKSHYQDFMKRLRHKTGPVRFFQCGEYGERLQRPHYHACLFGVDFSDKKKISEKGGIKLYESTVLNDAWGHGFASVGALTFESAAYVARYVTKKVTGPKAEEHYTRIDEDTGELYRLEPEYVTMSRGGREGKGLAHDWFEKYGKEVFRDDEVIMRGHPQQPPRYYEKLFEAAHGDLKGLKDRRLEKAMKHDKDNTPARLRDREKCAIARFKRLPRSFEDG